VTGIDGGFFKLCHNFVKEMGKTSNHLAAELPFRPSF
jgi:hypothetical protein